PALIPTIAGAGAASKLAEPKPLPVEAVRPELIKKLADQKAKELMRQDLARFMMEVRILGGNARPRDPEDVIEMAAFVVSARVAGFTTLDTYVQDFAASRGILSGGSTPAPGSPPGSLPMPRDEFTLEDDPGLEPLVRAQKESMQKANPFHGGRYIPF